MNEKEIIHQWANATKKIKKLTEPLQSYGIDHFSVIHSYDEGRLLNISNIDNWIENYYYDKLYLSSHFENHPASYFSCAYLWNDDLKGEVITKARNLFNSHHGLTIIDRKFKRTIFYFFSTRVDYNHIHHFYLNKMDLIYKFIFYFSNQTISLVNDLLEKRSSLIESYIDNPLPNFDIINQYNSIQNKEILDNFAISNLTKKEKECLFWLLKGFSSKEIANKTHNSSRTVEFHLNNLKEKFGCKTTLSLMSHVYNHYPDLSHFLLRTDNFPL